MIKETDKGVTLGIVGGMGPIASAEFMRTIYKSNCGQREQHAPKVILYSDPSFPDRTEVLLSGRSEDLLERLTDALSLLCNLGASQIVICCMTIHHLLPQLPESLRHRIISLLDVTVASMKKSRRKHLLICSNGTRQLRLFQSHEGWREVKDYLVFPNEEDQEWIHHELIYRIKMNSDVKSFVPQVKALLIKYQVNQFVAGCTEIHFLSKAFAEASGGGQGYECLDPLNVIAESLAERARQSRLTITGSR
jgi:aspartate racemase